MSFFKKIFASNKQKQKQKEEKKNNQKSSFLTWLCSSKSFVSQHEHYQRNNSKSISFQSSTLKFNISTIQTNNTKIMNRLSFGNPTFHQLIEEQLKSTLIMIQDQVIERVEDLIEQNGLYGMVNGDQPLDNKKGGNGIWLKIGKGEEINSLGHIKPYYFTYIFIFMDDFGFQFSIEQILLSKQKILLKIKERSSTQQIIDLYEKQLIQHYGFKPLCDCFSKLKLIVYKIKNNQSTWISFNKQTPINSHVEDILEKIGFNSQDQQYLKLKQQIPSLLTFQEYMEFIEHKNKLMSKYQGQNVNQYIKNKFMQKINSKSHTPRNTDSPRTIQGKISNQEDHSQSLGYNEYILSMTANTLQKDKVNQFSSNNIIITKIPDKNSYQEEIFEFNIYKEDKEQEAKRLAINKERKKRSRSEDITVGDLHNCEDLEEENDYFDKRD